MMMMNGYEMLKGFSFSVSPFSWSVSISFISLCVHNMQFVICRKESLLLIKVQYSISFKTAGQQTSMSINIKTTVMTAINFNIVCKNMDS